MFKLLTRSFYQRPYYWPGNELRSKDIHPHVVIQTAHKHVCYQVWDRVKVNIFQTIPMKFKLHNHNCNNVSQGSTKSYLIMFVMDGLLKRNHKCVIRSPDTRHNTQQHITSVAHGKCGSSFQSYGFSSWVLIVNQISGDWYRPPLIISQHFFEYRPGTVCEWSACMHYKI